MLRESSFLYFYDMSLTAAGRALDYQQVIDDFVGKTRDLRQFELSRED
jgi:hypothetical protein